MRIALIITTYNRPDALAAVLEGCLVQTDSNFEVIVADDGSTQDTADLIATYRARAPFAIKHVWQEDDGFRAAAIRNRALAATHADYVIFADGDCVPPPDFVASHRRLAERGWFLSGNRLMLTQAFTEQILRDKLPIHLWRMRDWLRARWHGQIERLLPLVQMHDLGWLRKQLPRRWQGAKTCNLSAWREDLLRVNGLDESYTGWGLEDSDLVVRLLRAGIKNKSARFYAPVFHLWHRENDRSQLAENRRRLEEVLQATHIRALKGVDQYL
ncbi:MAG: glycosyl transferase family 2 [Gallionellales bacterium RBG_16_56_9]|nr:MAG: glycosyl transferase family 2 [Gallionellales bacterium RBG_16_56_9]